MANYNADIRLNVTGKSQLNQLESQLKRVNKQVNALNKALTLKSRAQTIKLNTKGANTAIKQLEDRINRLGRTITVNVRTKESKSGGGSKGGGTLIVGGGSDGMAQQLAAAKALKPVAKALTNEAQDLLDASEAREKSIQKTLDLKKKITAEVEKQMKLERQLNTVENSTSEKARTANMNRIFGGNVSKAGNKLSPKQSMALAKQESSRLAASTQRLGKAYRAAREEVVQTSKAYQQLAGAAKRAAKAENESAAAAVKNANARKKFGKGFATGGGVALASAVGNLPVVGSAATGGLVAGLSGGSVAAGALGGAIVGIGAALVGVTKEVTAFNNELRLMQQSLAFTVNTSDELDTALGAIERASQDFLVPIGEATQQFTKLNAAARASGFTVEQVETVYRGLASANLALGGNAERLNGILLATQQVFSKGKVQAEELRGQIGERLAGAFAEFAKATGRSTKELDKALNDGEVSLKDFVAFAEKMLEKYEDKAKVIADAPENAGERLKLAMDNLKKAMGPILTSIGNDFTRLAIKAVNALANMADALNNFRTGEAGKQLTNTRESLQIAKQQLAEVEAGPDGPFKGLRIRALTANVIRLRNDLSAAQTAYNNIKAAQIQPLTPGGDPLTPGFDDLGGGGGSGGGSKGGGGRTKVDNLAERLRLAEQALAVAKLELAYAQEMNPLEQLKLDRNIELLRVKQDLTNELADEKDLGVQELIRQRATTEQLRVQAEYKRTLQDIGTDAGFSMGTAIADALKDTNKELTETDKLLRNAYDIMSGGMQDAINGLIRGTKDLNEVLSDMLGQLGNLFIQFAFSSLKTGIFGMANGGYPTPGEPVLVGENGPELIVPTAPTRVYNNHDTNAMLGKYSPGSGGGTITFESRIINNVEYVTAEQAIAMSEDAAKRGAEGGYTKTMGSLRNSRSTRQRVGI